jgi:hypothetical protein
MQRTVTKLTKSAACSLIFRYIWQKYQRMKNLCFLFVMGLSMALTAQKTIKSKSLKLKFTPPAGWNVQEFGSANTKTWEEPGNEMCPCTGVAFFKSHKDGKMNVVVYPSTQSGLDSAKRNFVGTLRFEDVAKVDRVRNNDISFERKKSNFTDSKTKTKSFEVYRYFAKVDDHFYIIYGWQENMQPLNSSNEKEIFAMVNSIEAI